MHEGTVGVFGLRRGLPPRLAKPPQGRARRGHFFSRVKIPSIENQCRPTTSHRNRDWPLVQALSKITFFACHLIQARFYVVCWQMELGFDPRALTTTPHRG